MNFILCHDYQTCQVFMLMIKNVIPELYKYSKFSLNWCQSYLARFENNNFSQNKYIQNKVRMICRALQRAYIMFSINTILDNQN